MRLKGPGPCVWNGNEIVREKEPTEAVAGLAPGSPDVWGPLFAAAPEMYETLEGLLYEHKPCGGELWHTGNEVCGCERCDGIRLVLAKARGDA